MTEGLYLLTGFVWGSVFTAWLARRGHKADMRAFIAYLNRSAR